MTGPVTFTRVRRAINRPIVTGTAVRAAAFLLTAAGACGYWRFITVAAGGLAPDLRGPAILIFLLAQLAVLAAALFLPVRAKLPARSSDSHAPARKARIR